MESSRFTCTASVQIEIQPCKPVAHHYYGSRSKFMNTSQTRRIAATDSDTEEFDTAAENNTKPHFALLLQCALAS
jgi:hypothetical protein